MTCRGDLVYFCSSCAVNLKFPWFSFQLLGYNGFYSLPCAMQVVKEIHALACLQQSLAELLMGQSLGHQIWMDGDGDPNPIQYQPLPAVICMRGANLLDTLNGIPWSLNPKCFKSVFYVKESCSSWRKFLTLPDGLTHIWFIDCWAQRRAELHILTGNGLSSLGLSRREPNLV